MFEALGLKSKQQNPSRLAEEGCSRNSSTTQLPPEEAQRPRSEFGDEPPGTPNTLVQYPSNIANQQLPPLSDVEEANLKQYSRFSPWRKISIVTIISYCAFLAPISSTAILIAVPEVGKTFGTNEEIINASNALYLVFMGISSTFWGPVSQVWGRRPVSTFLKANQPLYLLLIVLFATLQIFIISAILFCGFTIATTLSPDLPSYFVFRVLTAFQGTSFLVVGSSAVGDIYEPRTRATALVWVLSGSMVGPALGPFLGGVVVTFEPWRVVFWLLSAMNGFAAVLVFFFFPETINYKSSGELKGQGVGMKTKMIWNRINPTRVIVLLFKYINIFNVGLAAGALVWNQYALLTPIRSVINPRFGLKSPIQSGLFYLAPGVGYLAGSFVGGRWVDHCANKCIVERNGERVPEDRLKSSLLHTIFIVPACVLVYGWTLEKEVGGIPVPVIAMFIQGVSQLFCMPSMNTYCLDVMQAQGRSAEVIAGNYVARYVFAALGTGVALPAIEAMGVGWFSTMSAAFSIFTGGLLWLTAIYGPKWRQAVEAKEEQKIAARKGLE